MVKTFTKSSLEYLSEISLHKICFLTSKINSSCNHYLGYLLLPVAICHNLCRSKWQMQSIEDYFLTIGLVSLDIQFQQHSTSSRAEKNNFSKEHPFVPILRKIHDNKKFFIVCSMGDPSLQVPQWAMAISLPQHTHHGSW